MQSRPKPILLFVLAVFTLLAAVGQASSAQEVSQLGVRAYLPNLDKNYPPPPPEIVIDYSPPFDAWYHPANPNPEAIGRGRILNYESKLYPQFFRFALMDEEEGWRILSNIGCDPPPPPLDLEPINCATGEFTFAFGPLLINEIERMRFYLATKDYVIAPNDNGVIAAPPVPPTPGIVAMTEILRYSPSGWEVVQKIP